MHEATIDTFGFVPPWETDRSKKKPAFAEGIIRVYRVPDDLDLAYWWYPQTDGKGKILRQARMGREEKVRYQEAEGQNQIMNAGRTAVLSYIGSSSGSTTGWAQYLAIGTGAITATSASDTSLANEVFRTTQNHFSVNGTSVDINFALGTTDAQVVFTNLGLYGNGATSTLGSGTLYSHALFSYTKGSYTIQIDYVINLL